MRKQPYTQIGIRRLDCSVKGCKTKAVHQWQGCATGNLWMPLCIEHDIALNALALDFIGLKGRKKIMKEYAIKARS